MANGIVTRTLTAEEAKNGVKACSLQEISVYQPDSSSQQPVRLVLEICYGDERPYIGTDGVRRYKDENRSRFLYFDADKEKLVYWMKELVRLLDPPVEEQILDVLFDIRDRMDSN